MKKIILTFIFIQLCNGTEAQCSMQGAVNSGVRLSTTGSTKLDEILIRESVQMQNSFNVKVDLYAYEDGSSPNALAYASESVIQMGKTLMLDEFVNNGNENSIIAIMAHEFGHIIQVKYNLNASGTWIGKYPELHADFMAGWYMGTKQYITKEELHKMAYSFWDKGDGDYFSPSHHGTNEERTSAFMMGYWNANLALVDAYNKGIEYVVNIEERIKQVKAKASNTDQSKGSVATTGNVKKGKAVIFIGEGKMKKAEIYLTSNGNITVDQVINNDWTSNGFTLLNGQKTLIGVLDKKKNQNEITIELPPGVYGVVYKSGRTEGWTRLVVTSNNTASLDILNP